MRIGATRRVRLSVQVVVAAMLVGSAYGSLLNFVVFGKSRGALVGALIGALHGLIISSTIGWMEIFGIRTRPGRAIEEAPLLMTLLVKGLIYGSIVTFVNVVEPGTRLLGISPLHNPLQFVSLIFSCVATVAFIFVLQLSRIVGGRPLRDWSLGRYHRPFQEDRFFLFLDIVGSTTLAERLGPVGVHQFLNRVFVMASDPIDDHRGEIYQYVGDEMVITWTEVEGRLGARPIRCFLAIEALLESSAPQFERDFGSAPRVRGALHAGPVIAGEVGGSKRDIVFHGDVMNTTSRLEQVGRELDRRLVISADAVRRLLGAEEYPLEDLGTHVVRGRTTEIQIYAMKSSVGERRAAATSRDDRVVTAQRNTRS
jgi:adenylate cyclase